MDGKEHKSDKPKGVMAARFTLRNQLGEKQEVILFHPSSRDAIKKWS